MDKEHAVENNANNLIKRQHSAFPETNGKAPIDFSELEFH